jgi:ubiquinone/menaquinone biosynthesis C-methylase UbiE
VVDWAAYDAVAGRYDAVWGARFSAVADLVWRRVGRVPHASVLDVGTGTGILPQALLARDHTVAIAAGCDRSIGMLEVARTHTPSLRAVAADGQMLPFRDAAFDAATASFVMSHISDYPAALAEMRRVLRSGGRVAITSWAAGEDGPSQAWSRVMAEFVPAHRIQSAFARVAPSMAQFEDAMGVARALREAGFAEVSVESHSIESRVSVPEFIADRELTSGARYARHVLPSEEWDRLVERAQEELERRFGDRFTFSRGALIGLGRKA